MSDLAPLPIAMASGRTHRKALMALIGAAVAFGTTFVVVQDAVADADPTVFLTIRFAIGAAVLGPLAAARSRARRRNGVMPAPWRPLWSAGIAAGAVLSAGYLLQTIGLQHTTTQASAFLTYLLVVFVPPLSFVLLGRPPTWWAIVGVAVAVVGVGLLTGGTGVGLGRGEMLTIGCAVAFAAHVIVLARVAPRFDLVRLNAVQLATVAAVCAPFALFARGPVTAPVLAAAAYTGVVASALAFLGQLYGQRHLDPTRVAIVLLIEPVAAAVLGAARGESLGVRGFGGAALIVGAVLLVELTPARAADDGPIVG